MSVLSFGIRVFQVLPIVKLEYKTAPPLDAVFTDEVFMQCNKLFSHLLGMERIRVLHKKALEMLKGLPASTSDHHKVTIMKTCIKTGDYLFRPNLCLSTSRFSL